jgi:hypothetical protein
MLPEFAIDYLQWVFVSAFAAFQFVAAKNRLQGLMLVRGFPLLTRVAALALMAVAAIVYFVSEPRNQPDSGLGLDANEQGRWFAIAAATAIMVTMVVTSVVNHRWGAEHGWDEDSGEAPPSGVAWLQRTTFARALTARVRFARRTRAGVAGVDRSQGGR